MTLDTQTLIAWGVGAHLLASLAKWVFKTPRQQAQIDRLEGKIETVLTTLTLSKAPETAGKETATP